MMAAKTAATMVELKDASMAGLMAQTSAVLLAASKAVPKDDLMADDSAVLTVE